MKYLLPLLALLVKVLLHRAEKPKPLPVWDDDVDWLAEFR